ncbi:hypothetical protein MAFF241648_21220 [Ralstonia solanacearum]|nr:hypothetical protein MAFF241648_21220 [Ralstonia solanacearum]
MTNETNLYHLFLYAKHYIFFGGIIPITVMIVGFLYFMGAFHHRAIIKEREQTHYSIKARMFYIHYLLFIGVNKLVDIIAGLLAHKLTKVWVEMIPDSLVEKLFKLKPSMSERIAVAKAVYPASSNTFFWQKLRAPDFHSISPIMKGKWWNNEPVEDHLPFLVSQKTINTSFKMAMLCAVTVFVALVLVYKPQLYLGFRPARVTQDYVNQASDILKNNISLVPELRGEYWTEEEYEQARAQAAQLAPQYAAELIDNANGYNYAWWGIFFKDGVMTSLLASIAVGMLMFRVILFRSFKLVKVPFILDSHELYGAERATHENESAKRSIAAANKLATGYHKDAPILKLTFCQSTGSLEANGAAIARRYRQNVTMGLFDLAQNLMAFGSIGSGKSEAAKDLANVMFDLKNINLASEEKYRRLFDLRTNRLTEQAIKEGYLKEYKKLPVPRLSVGLTMMDIKAQLYKDLFPAIERKHLQGEFKVIGGKSGQFAIDLIAKFDPSRLVAATDSISKQMGAEMKKDFFSLSGNQWFEVFADVAYLFTRTSAARKYMRKKMHKVWSLAFIATIIAYDPKGELLALACHAILTDIKKYPERFADILTTKRIKSVQDVLVAWQDPLITPDDTKGGIAATMKTLVADFTNDAISPFLTGLGENIKDIGEFWHYFTGYDLSTDEYGPVGKLAQLFCKTLTYGESVSRQLRFARRSLEISDYFRTQYPELLTKKTSVEFLGLSILSEEESKQLFDEYFDICDKLQEECNKQWEYGFYESELEKVVSSLPPLNEADQDMHYNGRASQVAAAQRALECANRIRELEPRLAKELLPIVELDPTIFNAKEGDSAEVAAEKERRMHLFYEMTDAMTRVRREFYVIMIDEAQEAVTVDSTGVIYTESNWLNINRSTNACLIMFTQSKSALVNKIDEKATNNMLGSMRNRIFFSTDDQLTMDELVRMTGTGDVFKSPYLGKPLLNDGRETGYAVYNNFNNYIAELACKNMDVPAEARSQIYPYTYDIITKGNSIDADVMSINVKGLYSTLFDSQKVDLGLPSMKYHFLNTSGVAEYKSSGTEGQTQDNKDAIKQEYKQAYQGMDEKYQQYLKDGYSKDLPLFSKEDYNKQSNAHFYIVNQRAGMTIQDHQYLVKA